MKLITTILTVSLFCLVASCGSGGNEQTVPEAQPAEATFADIGDHVVHFSAQSTDQLPPDVARIYNIVRSKNRAMLNISVIEKSSSGAVTANVTVNTKNLTGQLKNVLMRKIEERDAIYYIGETPVANRETLVFNISVKPDGADKTSELRFKRQFYTD